MSPPSHQYQEAISYIQVLLRLYRYGESKRFSTGCGESSSSPLASICEGRARGSPLAAIGWGEQQLSTGCYMREESSSSPLAAIGVGRAAALHWRLFVRGEQQLSTGCYICEENSNSPLAAIC